MKSTWKVGAEVAAREIRLRNNRIADSPVLATYGLHGRPVGIQSSRSDVNAIDENEREQPKGCEEVDKTASATMVGPETARRIPIESRLLTCMARSSS